MKKIFFLLFITLNSFGQIHKSDLQKLRLIGKVKSIQETNFSGVEKSGKITDEISNGKNKYVYDQKGNQILEEGYHPNGNLIMKGVIILNEKGNKIETQNYGEDGKPWHKSKYVYDKKGNQIEENVYSNDGSLRCKFTNAYDNKGNQIESEFHQFHMREFTEITKYVYDDKGNQIERHWYNEDKRLIYLNKYVYDEKGNEVEELSCKADGTIKFKTEYKYTFDSRGNWITRLKKNNLISSCDYSEREIVYFD